MIVRVLLLALAVLLLTPASASFAQADDLRINNVDQDNYPQIDVTLTAPALPGNQRLPKDAFTVSEDGEVRTRSIGDRPNEDVSLPSVVLVLDVSGSMRATTSTGGTAIDVAKAAADDFVQQLPPGTEIGVVTFGDAADVIVPFTSNTAAVQGALAAVTADRSAGTALYEGAVAAADLLETAENELKSVVLLSDGRNTTGAHDLRTARQRLRRTGAATYAIGLQTAESNPEALESLVGSAGRVVPASAPEELTGIYSNLASDLSTQYLIQYESEASGETELAIEIDWPGVDATATRTITVNSEPGGSPATLDVPAPPPYTVTLPLLATTPALVTALIAIAAGTLVLLVLLVGPRRISSSERLAIEWPGSTRPRLTAIAEWTIQAADRRLRRGALGQRLDRTLEQAGLDLRPGELVVMVVSAIVVAFAVGVLLANETLGVVLAAIVPAVTRLVLSVLRDRRQAAFADQLTDVLQLISGNLRAGYGLLQGVDTVTRDAEDPAASEFRRVLVEHRLGRDLNDAMNNCAERMGNADFSWVVQAFNIHRDVGGDLARVLDNIIATVRERADVHRQVRALSAEGRMSAIVLTALPVVVFVIIQLTSPDYMSELLNRPLGLVMIGVAVLMLVTGSLWIRRLVQVRY